MAGSGSNTKEWLPTPHIYVCGYVAWSISHLIAKSWGAQAPPPPQPPAGITPPPPPPTPQAFCEPPI